MKNSIFVPIEQKDEIICEVDMESTFADTTKAYLKEIPAHKIYEFQGKEYKINIANEKYHVLNKQRICVCCGIHTTRMFLGRFDDHGIQGYNFRVFAETRNRPDADSHLILMTKDHIIPKNNGGRDVLENYQTLCSLCNHMKAIVGLSLEQIQSCLFTAYRIYQGTIPLRKTKENLFPLKQQYKKCLKTIDAINNNISKTENHRTKDGMLIKQQQLFELATVLQKQIIDAEKEAQISGNEIQAMNDK